MVMKNKAIFNVFFREKPAMMLVMLKTSKQGIYASSLAKMIDCGQDSPADGEGGTHQLR